MYKLDVKTDETGKTISFIASWEFPKFLFIEHLAVDPCCRGKGMGSKIMKEFINNSKKPIILEIEIPKDEISIKRKKFYEKLGFKELRTIKDFFPSLKKNASDGIVMLKSVR